MYHVGKPEMLEGKRFFGLTGMPILKAARTSMPFAVWLPEPLTVATTIEKSFTISGRSPDGAASALSSTSAVLMGVPPIPCSAGREFVARVHRLFTDFGAARLVALGV